MIIGYVEFTMNLQQKQFWPTIQWIEMKGDVLLSTRVRQMVLVVIHLVR